METKAETQAYAVEKKWKNSKDFLTRWLEREIEAAANELAAARQLASPHYEAIDQARAALFQLHDRRREGEVISSAQIIAACDDQMQVRFAAFPFTEPVRILHTYLRELTKELERETKLAKIRKKQTKQLSLLD